MDILSIDFLDRIAFPAKGIRATMIQNASGGWIGDSGSSRELSNPTDLKWLLAHRYVADAVLVGSSTALSENYQKINCSDEISSWRKKHNLKPNPLLITVTRDSNKIQDLLEISDFVITTSNSLPDVTNSRIIRSDSQEINWIEVVDKLNELGVIRINCEGGPTLISKLLSQGLIDQFVLTKSPISGAVESVPSIDDFLTNNSAQSIITQDNFDFQHVGELKTWEDLLTVGEYFVLRDAGTQAPFSVDYEKKPAAGYYTCRSCGARLFDATDQFDARCGWPAFWKPNDHANLILEDDHSKGYLRVEVKCGSCDSHLGHVFHGEGFGFPTDDRYCINAICLIRKYD
jgi:peptide-methionine (R)-S-oxide reductase